MTNFQHQFHFRNKDTLIFDCSSKNSQIISIDDLAFPSYFMKSTYSFLNSGHYFIFASFLQKQNSQFKLLNWWAILLRMNHDIWARFGVDFEFVRVVRIYFHNFLSFRETDFLSILLKCLFKIEDRSEQSSFRGDFRFFCQRFYEPILGCILLAAFLAFRTWTQSLCFSKK